ncbi:MAG: general secretion pathway protein GspK [Sphingomonas sp.]|uniref:general secretion pathway protein GspK n=1 Tax=Sphingomonas sp. TaxID=28214 RepID=UPI0025CD7D21|nr:type II secretion system protein GspK [Sphingomonas sp.]MBY0283532.1 general secretion pathway protein GspK [Sphingomonas sp.]
MTPRRQGEQGYALLAAVASIALLSMLSMMMMLASQGTVVMAAAESDQARLTAAADGGVALALQGVLQSDRRRRWAIDGQVHRVTFAGYDLAIAVIDERGKIPLNRLNRHQSAAMFEAFGLSGADRDIAVDSFLDWRDQNDDANPDGAEADYYAPKGLLPRNGNLRNVGELALIRGVGPAVAARIIPFATVDFGPKGDFDPRFASPIARRIMADEEELTPTTIGGETAIAKVSAPVGDPNSLIDHPLTIRVDASTRDGRARTRRQLIVSLTGIDARPYLVRGRD